jgi:hypothetical protein
VRAGLAGGCDIKTSLVSASRRFSGVRRQAADLRIANGRSAANRGRRHGVGRTPSKWDGFRALDATNVHGRTRCRESPRVWAEAEKDQWFGVGSRRFAFEGSPRGDSSSQPTRRLLFEEECGTGRDAWVDVLRSSARTAAATPYGTSRETLGAMLLWAAPRGCPRVATSSVQDTPSNPQPADSRRTACLTGRAGRTRAPSRCSSRQPDRWP